MTGARRRPALVFVVALGRNGVIGQAGALPWRLPSELKRFRAVTMGRPMLMGRKTYAAIGRPLDGRETVVVTRDRGFAAGGVHVAHDLEDGLALSARLAQKLGTGEIMVVGGGDIYRQLMDRADRLVVTEVDAEPAGDTLFPAIDPGAWERSSREEHPAGPRDDHAYAVVEYVRRSVAERMPPLNEAHDGST